MKLTVVTVCFNSAKTIGKCMDSVLKLDTNDYEYVIVDGKSTDNTLSIIEGYKSSFYSKNVDLRIVSEKDSGIYNAMNKAIELARGDWIIFLNSDDFFLNIISVFDILEGVSDEIDIVYGDVMVSSYGVMTLQKPRNLERLRSGNEMPFCHQSTFVRNATLKKYRFDECYRIIADIDLFLRMYEDKLLFLYKPICVSVFSNEGLSQTHRIESIKEGKRLLINHKCYGFKRRVLLNTYLLWYNVKPYLPQFVLTALKL